MKPTGVARRLCLILLVLSLSVPAFAAERGPSTAEERQRAVEVVETLETQPASEATKEGLVWLLQWLIEVPDVTVSVCPQILGSDSEIEDLPAQLKVHHAFAAARHVIETPGIEGTSAEAFLAGVTGTLRAYSSMRRSGSLPPHRHLDGLLEKQAAGKLAEHVRKRVKHCG